MDEIEIQRRINDLTNFALQRCREQNIRLSEQAFRLIIFASEAFMRESPRSRQTRYQTSEYETGAEIWVSIGRDILSRALQDPRVAAENRDRERVMFPTLLRVLADEGFLVLQAMGFKD